MMPRWFREDDFAEKYPARHCEDRFARRGNLEVIAFFYAEIEEFIPNVDNEIASPAARNDMRRTTLTKTTERLFQ
jgi:hypothetical protein